MLSLLGKANSSRGEQEIDSPSATPVQIQELTILSALATILVREHECVAVVAKSGNDAEGRVEIFVCTDSVADKPTSTFLGNIWNILTTINTRKDVTPDGPNAYPTILDATYRSDRFESHTLDELDKKALSNWWGRSGFVLPVLDLTTYHRKKEGEEYIQSDFVKHARLVTAFIQYHKANLLSYVVIACHRKIRRRLFDPLSKPYWEFIQYIASSPTFPQYETFTPSHSLKRKHTANDNRFFKMMGKLQRILKIKVPKLLAISEATGERDIEITAYNKDTYKEYHMILHALLKHFRQTLDSLNAQGVRSATQTFEETVASIVTLGDALQAMAGGNIITMHMKVITKGRNMSIRSTHDDTIGEPERDEEIYKIGSTLPMWEAYYEWLKLMVVHYDAVRVLVTHHSSQTSPIRIKVISAPKPDNSQTNWKVVLKNERYFHNALPGNLSTNDIIAFLEKWRDEQRTVGSSVQKVIEEWHKLKHDEVLDSEFADSIIEKMKNMSFCQSPGSQQVVSELVDDLESFKNTRLTLKQLNEVSIDLESLRDRALFFKSLNGQTFKGAIHCEVILACFMLMKSSECPQEYKKIVDELAVSCIISTFQFYPSYTLYRVLGLS